jgi:acetoin utilization deacetylase AcuC-like enzyme
VFGGFYSGADMLHGDPLGGFNVTLKTIEEIVSFLDDLRTCRNESLYPEQYKIPMLVLGGGGYNMRNTVNLATLFMSLLVNSRVPSLELPPDLDYCNLFFKDKLPPYTCVANPNRNSIESLEKITNQILSNINYIQPVS